MIKQSISTTELEPGKCFGEIHVMGKVIYKSPFKDSELAAYLNCSRHILDYCKKYGRSLLIDAINNNYANIKK